MQSPATWGWHSPPVGSGSPSPSPDSPSPSPGSPSPSPELGPDSESLLEASDASEVGSSVLPESPQPTAKTAAKTSETRDGSEGPSICPTLPNSKTGVDEQSEAAARTLPPLDTSCIKVV